MARPLVRRTVLVLLATLLCALPAAAAPPAADGRYGAILTTLWDFLASLLDAGCRIDPNGCNAATAPLEEGCGIDPDGCASAQGPPPPDYSDAGCGIDPNGHCAI